MKPGIFTSANNPRNGVRRWLTFFLTAFLFLSTQALHAQDVLVGLTSNGGPDGKGTAYTIKTNGSAFNVVKSFVDWGQHPVSDLIKGPDGWFYGMMPEGGTYGYGAIFKMSSSGQMIVLKNFDYTVDGGYPYGSLLLAKDGNFYGLTSSGSVNNGGCIFKLTINGQYSVLRSLAINTDGGNAKGHLVQGKDGNFYGLTYGGGANGYGVIFKYTTGGAYTVLRSFSKATDGGNPYGSLVVGPDSALYGLNYWGGTYDNGTIFRITTSGSFKVLRHLKGSTDGGYPTGDLTAAKDGSLYGLTSDIGANYNGTAFKISTTGTFKLLKTLSSGVEGGNPKGSFIQASDGYLYALTTNFAGYAGSVFKMSTGGTTTVVRKFTEATDGGRPRGGLVQGSDGLLYGMTYQGGKNGGGTIFKITTGGTYTVLVHLNGGAGGNAPQGVVAMGKDSAFYGINSKGGPTNNGSIFKICSGNTTVLRVLNRSTDGGNPQGGLVRAGDGNLYGTTSAGGTNNGGTVFRITPSGTFTVLRHLSNATDGSSPVGTLVVGTDGNLYGTTASGGTKSGGTIFKLTTGGTFTVLYNLNYSTEGSNSTTSPGSLVAAKDGFIYGLTGNNTHFFKISTSGAFTLMTAITTTSTQGSLPFGNLMQGTDGNFYGTMSSGGSYSAGTIFKISTSGAFNVLRQLNSTTDGGNPKGTLVQGTDGALYGTTSTGGTNKAGTIFRITTAGSFSVLRHLKMTTDGGTPLGGLVKSPMVTLVANAQSTTTNEDVAKAITLTGSGATTLGYNIAVQPRHGTVSGTGAARTYTPATNFNGVDSFAFVSTVGCLSSAQAWVKITVASVNDAPVLTTIGNKSVVAGSTLKFTASATDVDAGQTLTFSLASAPSGATISGTTGAFSWTPTTAGTYTFKVRVTDNGSPVLYDEETITVTVTAPALTTSATVVKNGKPTEEVAPVVEAILYPNPVVSSFTINFNKALNDVKLTILDMNGAAVYSKQYSGYAQQLQIAAGQLSSGSYMVLLQTTDGTQTLKFIKQ